MSSDDGVYILQTKGPEYRIAHTQAIDNIYGSWDSKLSVWQGNSDYIYSVFGNSQIYDDIEEAYDSASDIEKKNEGTEYGVCLIKDFEERKFEDFQKNLRQHNDSSDSL